MRLDKFLKVSRLIKRRTVANEAVDNVLRNDERGFVVLLCGGHGAVALKFAQIGAV